MANDGQAMAGYASERAPNPTCVLSRVGISELSARAPNVEPVANNAQPFQGFSLAPNRERARDCTPVHQPLPRPPSRDRCSQARNFDGHVALSLPASSRPWLSTLATRVPSLFIKDACSRPPGSPSFSSPSARPPFSLRRQSTRWPRPTPTTRSPTPAPTPTSRRPAMSLSPWMKSVAPLWPRSIPPSSRTSPIELRSWLCVSPPCLY